jgi:zona occludens toxin (predicted ATPase)
MESKGIIKGDSKKRYIKANLKALGLSGINNRYLMVNTDGKSYKIKTNYTGERKKIHLTKEIFELLITLIKELESN